MIVREAELEIWNSTELQVGLHILWLMHLLRVWNFPNVCKLGGSSSDTQDMTLLGKLVISLSVKWGQYSQAQDPWED